MPNPEIIVDAIADGLSISEAAQRFDLTENEVRAILRQAVERCYDGTYMREAWMLEARRLAAVGLKFYRKAMDDADPQVAIVFIKIDRIRGKRLPVSIETDLKPH